jgi:hypothetical protein
VQRKAGGLLGGYLSISREKGPWMKLEWGSSEEKKQKKSIQLIMGTGSSPYNIRDAENHVQSHLHPVLSHQPSAQL